MAEVFPGRFTAQLDKPVVMFLIGMRFNNLLDISKWWQVFTAMPKMLKELDKKPDCGMLWYRNYISGRTTLLQQYWESFDKLLAYAHDKEGKHFPAWAAFNKKIGGDGSVGIWHETYLIEPDKYECIYGNMPAFGLAAATKRVPATGRLAAAKDRFAA